MEGACQSIYDTKITKHSAFRDTATWKRKLDAKKDKNHHKVLHTGQGFNPSSLVPVLGYTLIGVTTHNTILVQKSLRWSVPSSPPSLSTLTRTYFKAENGLGHLSVNKTSMAPTALHPTMTRTLWIWPHFSVLISHSPTTPSSIRQALLKALSAFKLYTEDFHSAETGRWKVCGEWVGLERQAPGSLPTPGSTPTQIYSLSSAVSPIPTHALHQVPAFYSKNKSWRQMTGMYLHSSCLNAILS